MCDTVWCGAQCWGSINCGGSPCHPHSHLLQPFYTIYVCTVFKHVDYRYINHNIGEDASPCAHKTLASDSVHVCWGDHSSTAGCLFADCREPGCLPPSGQSHNYTLSCAFYSLCSVCKCMGTDKGHSIT